MFPELRAPARHPSRSLSGGEQQMLVLAQALVSKPKFVLIDELSLGLAPVVVKRLIPTIEKLADEGIGVLLIEQFATIALGMANEAYVMGHGKIEFSGTASELKKKPELLQSAYLTQSQHDQRRRGEEMSETWDAERRDARPRADADHPPLRGGGGQALPRRPRLHDPLPPLHRPGVDRRGPDGGARRRTTSSPPTTATTATCSPGAPTRSRPWPRSSAARPASTRAPAARST